MYIYAYIYIYIYIYINIDIYRHMVMAILQGPVSGPRNLNLANKIDVLNFGILVDALNKFYV